MKSYSTSGRVHRSRRRRQLRSAAVRTALILVLALILAACGSGSAGELDSVEEINEGLNSEQISGEESAAAEFGEPTQTHGQGPVTVTVTWEGPAGGLTFRVDLDTHSVDLDGYDLKERAALRIDGGAELLPAEWHAAQGGHHRTGTLTFAVGGADGEATQATEMRDIMLVIYDVGDVPERNFRWMRQ